MHWQHDFDRRPAGSFSEKVEGCRCPAAIVGTQDSVFLTSGESLMKRVQDQRAESGRQIADSISEELIG